MRATELLVGYVTSDMLQEQEQDIEDVLIPSYLKTQHEGFLTAAYTYDGAEISAHACNPRGGRWRTVYTFQPENKVAVDGIGLQDSLRVFGSDRERAVEMEDTLFDALDDIYERRVRQTSVIDAQIEAAREHATCPDEKETQTTLTVAESDNGVTADPVVCGECMRLHAVVVGGRRYSVEDARRLTDADNMISITDDYTALSVTSWNETVAAATLWYEARRTEDRMIHPASDDRQAWLLIHNGETAVGYMTWDNEQTPIFRDIYITDDHRGHGAAIAGLRRWIDIVAGGDPFFIDADQACQSLMQEAAPTERNVIPSYRLARLELGDEAYSSD